MQPWRNEMQTSRSEMQILAISTYPNYKTGKGKIHRIWTTDDTFCLESTDAGLPIRSSEIALTDEQYDYVYRFYLESRLKGLWNYPEEEAYERRAATRKETIRRKKEMSNG